MIEKRSFLQGFSLIMSPAVNFSHGNWSQKLIWVYLHARDSKPIPCYTSFSLKFEYIESGKFHSTENYQNLLHQP